MGFGAVNVDIGGILSGLGTTATALREAITGKKILDPVKLAEIEASVAKMQADLSLAQVKVNEAEAASPSFFVAAWRPFIGWVCGVAFALHFLIFPVARVIIAWFNAEFAFPTFDIQTLVTILMGMLGLAGIRTYEKIKDVQDKH